MMKIIPLAAACAALAAPAAPAAAHAAACQARSAATPPRVVELYTSEGCSSCPPADRWLSTLGGRGDVLALAFHVNYWDRLGWPDRFALAEGTARQHTLARLDGAANVYTPQVRVDGADWRRWPRLPQTPAAATAPTLALQRDGDIVTAQVGAASRSPLAGYWAVLEDGHASRVGAGENAGRALRHDHVVRLYRPLPAWDGAAAAQHRISVARGTPEHPRRVAFVVTDASGATPLQAVALAC